MKSIIMLLLVVLVSLTVGLMLANGLVLLLGPMFPEFGMIDASTIMQGLSR